MLYREICCLIHKEIREDLWVIFPSVRSRALSGSSDSNSAGVGNSRFGKTEELMPPAEGCSKSAQTSGKGVCN